MPDLSRSPTAVAQACFGQPTMVLGDLHGRSDLLDALLRRVPGDMPVVCVGDLCDRGPDTRGVLDRLIDRGAVSVRGNHDEWFTRWATGGGLDHAALSPAIDGWPTLRSYGVARGPPAEIEAAWQAVPAAHRDWLAALPVALDLNVCGQPAWVVHAGVPLTEDLQGLCAAEVIPSLARRRPASLLWPRTDPEVMLPLDRPVFIGHVVQRRARDLGHVVALDTGCGRPGGRFSGMLLPSRRVIAVG